MGRTIYNEQGMVLLQEHVELNDTLIRKLESHGVDMVYIHDSRTEDIEIMETITPETRSRALSQIKQNFSRTLDQFQRKRTVPSHLDKEFKGIVQMLLEDLGRHDQALISLSELRGADEHLFNHSLNVGLYSIILGLSEGYTNDQLMTLGMGGLLHDIGKMQINQRILNKPGKLTGPEMDIVKRHTELGFQMLKDIPNISLITAHCALQHHERMDGSGYPRGIKGEDIHEYAQWIGIVDSFDAMTSHRTYRTAMLPHKAMEILYTGSGTLFDQQKLMKLRDKIAIYPIGITVKLNTGEKGVVVDLNASSLHRPVVRILEDAEGSILNSPYEVDLSKKLNIMITDLLYEL
ncbi:HD-GYP domain-containing protein [Marinicrinis lubricantis]